MDNLLMDIMVILFHHFFWQKPTSMALLWTIIIPFLSLLACLLSIPQIFIHVQTRNFAASVYALSSAFANLQNLINALTWPRFDPQTSFNGKILCDIEVKAYIGLTLAVLGAVASILRQMAVILDPNHMALTASPTQRYIRIGLEGILCILLPLLVMATHYVVQSFRYGIAPLSGCIPIYDNSWMSVILQFVWPPLVCLLGTVYCILCIIRLVKQRARTLKVLPDVPAAVRMRYLRLFGLACTSLVFYFPLSMYAFCRNFLFVRHPFAWDKIHPPQWTDRVVWARESPNIIEFDRWVQIALGFVGFGFFGLGQDAITMYKMWLLRIRIAMGWPQKERGHPEAGNMSLQGGTRTVRAGEIVLQ